MTTAWHATLQCDCLKLTCFPSSSRMSCLVRVWANFCHPDTKDSWEPNFAVHALGPRNPKLRALLLHHAVIARSSCLPMFSCTVEPQPVQTNCTLLHSMICIILMTSVASWQPSGWIYCSLGTVICPHPSRFPTASSFFSSASQCRYIPFPGMPPLPASHMPAALGGICPKPHWKSPVWANAARCR